MNITVYRGTNEIGGTLIELNTKNSKVIFDVGYPLFLNGLPIDDKIATFPYEKLLELSVLPNVKGLYIWDEPQFDAVIISHAHMDHYGLLKYINKAIPIYMSLGTHNIISISQAFKICDNYSINERIFKMYDTFKIGDFSIKPYLMDHSSFDSAAFEIVADGKTVIYTGDFRGHGRKAICLEHFVNNAPKNADMLLIEGSMFGRSDEDVITEDALELKAVNIIKDSSGIVMFQTSSQNIDRIVSFYRATLKSGRLFIIDIYTANVLYTLKQEGHNIPCPSKEYPNIKVFYPYKLTKKIFDEIGEDYARRFSEFHISKDFLIKMQSKAVIMVRPSMLIDIKKMNFKDGGFIYSMWTGYRNNEYQLRFERFLEESGFSSFYLHTSGHAKIEDINRVISELNPKKVVPIHTMYPKEFLKYSDKVFFMSSGKEITI